MAEAERWRAPERWVAVANRRACGYYRPVIRRLASELLGLLDAWDGFCREHLNVDGETAMRAHWPEVADRMADARVRYAGITPWAATREGLRSTLEGAWGKRFG